MANLQLRLAHLYPKELNIYGDYGNVLTIQKRCEWRDIDIIIDEIQIGEINPLNIMRCKIMHYTSFVGDSFKTQIELLESLGRETVLSFDPGMLYAKKGFDELKPILERTDILLINESELRLLCNNNETAG